MSYVRGIGGYLILAALLHGSVHAQQPDTARKKEEPVGLVLLATGAKIVRSGTETPIAARTGDILFPGDVLRSEAASAAFLFCPTKTSNTLAPSGEVKFDAKNLKVSSGKIADQKPAASCFLPQVVRVAVASQQHYGASLTRDLAGLQATTASGAALIPPEVAQELKPVDAALAANPADNTARLARAAILENANLPALALVEYRSVAAQWKEATWIKGKIFELEENVAAAAAKAAAAPLDGGQTYALLIGVSKYQKLPQELWLRFAHRDAETFAAHLQTPRGGGLPRENITVVTDERATTAAIRNAFQSLLKGKAGKQDTIVILVAGHGTVEVPGSKKAYILSYDSDPQDLASTAVPMEDVQNLVQEKLTGVGRVVLFVDVCRAGAIGTIKSTTVNSSVERLAEADGEIFGLMASRPKELSHESDKWGGGHGAFSYFLMKAMTGAADKNSDGIVNVNETIEYVREQVAAATEDKQHPRDFGNIDNAVQLADHRKPGINLTSITPPARIGGGVAHLAAAAPSGGMLAQALEAGEADRRFEQAINAGRLLPSAPDNAFTALSEIERSSSNEVYADRKNRLRIALEERAQQVLLRYMTGDQEPQSRGDFENGAQYAAAALRLTPESQLLQGREAFFRGRALIFDKNFPQAIDRTEEAIRYDQTGAYSYNALGIAYLEQARFDDAIRAFRDAVRLAPHWSYPLHNLALSYVETGDYNGAIRSYREAMRITPRFSYLPYNLGLVYQRLNRRKDAEAAYRKAMSLAPESAEPYNAMGTLLAAQGKAADAERHYREALAKKPGMPAARHNLALLLAGDRERHSEAIATWRGILAEQPDFLPSRLSLADLLASSGDMQAALAEYRRVVEIRPEYVGARLTLATLLGDSGDPAGALVVLEEAMRHSPGDPFLLEKKGDLEAQRGNAAQARDSYESALSKIRDGGARKRVRAKQRRLSR